MDKLYSWTVRRAGGAMTITHSCGKVVNVQSIEPRGLQIVATGGDGREYELSFPRRRAD